MADLTRAARLGDADAAAGERRLLRAGPLSVLLDGPDLRYVRLGSHELLRRVYAAVRDANWGTVPPRVSDLRADAAEDHFEVAFQVAHVTEEIDFRWRGRIVGQPDGAITYDMEGEARRAFRKNRIGLCVLHPLACAGLPCAVRHSDGAIEQTRFPVAIAPHQPFMDVRGLAHEALPGLWADVSLEGDVFETEDQRNWTDASFKTYSTPLARPFPVEIPAGARVRQRLTLRLRGDLPALADPPGELTYEVGGPALPLPRLGFGLASHGRPLDSVALRRLRALRPDHLRADLDLTRPGWRDRLALAAAEATALGATLHAALVVSDAAEAELAALRAAVGAIRPAVGAWLVFHAGEKATPAWTVALARRALADLAPGAPFGGGTDAYFTELNRARPPRVAFDLVCYAINPQVHAFDNLSLVETLAGQAETLASARTFCGDAPLLVGPVTLRPRFNPDATAPEAEPAAGALPAAVDRRQLSLFAAGWTLGSLKQLTLGGAWGATYYETTGWRGLMETAEGSPLPAAFPSRPGMLFPLYHVFLDVAELGASHAAPGRSSEPLQLDGLTLHAGARRRLLLANFTGEARDVRVVGVAAERAVVGLLAERSYERATMDGEAFRAAPAQRLPVKDGAMRLVLPPYAVARLDWDEADSHSREGQPGERAGERRSDSREGRFSPGTAAGPRGRPASRGAGA